VYGFIGLQRRAGSVLAEIHHQVAAATSPEPTGECLLLTATNVGEAAIPSNHSQYNDNDRPACPSQKLLALGFKGNLVESFTDLPIVESLLSDTIFFE
jgi:hypothetical protein